MKSRSSITEVILLAFLLCALVDFARGYFHERSIADGVISIFLGLFGTALYAYFFFGDLRKDKRKPTPSANGPEGPEPGAPKS